MLKSLVFSELKKSINQLHKYSSILIIYATNAKSKE